jgi:uncharacterized protein YecE (DUF72 family)
VNRGSAHVGTSGWSYRHWRGCVYPGDVRAANWFGYLAARFDTVEVNTSFYRIPRPEMIARWDELAPPGFQFALKMWRGITHYSKLKNAARNVNRFLEVAELLPSERRAPMLVQLPPNQGIDTEKLDTFLHEWTATSDARWRLAVEFRNDSWIVPETLRVLDRHRAALCLHDMAGVGAVAEPNAGAPFVYVRRHGPGDRRYSGNYSSEHIRSDARQIRGWINSGRDVYIYFNNDIGGHAFHNALELKEMLNGRAVE